MENLNQLDVLEMSGRELNISGGYIRSKYIVEGGNEDLHLVVDFFRGFWEGLTG